MELDRRTLIATGIATGIAAACAPPASAQRSADRFPLWPGRPPGGAGVAVEDRWVKRSPDGDPGDIAWPNVATPMLTVTRATAPNGAAVLICPGGGYRRVAVGRQGSAIARMFAGRGITAFDLLYRLPHDGWAAGPDAPLQDAQRAVRVIRARAGDWGIDPARVAVAGFSAGGHLAARTASRAATETYPAIDAADRLSARPIVAGLFFPVITMTEPFAHGGSRDELLGQAPADAMRRRFSAELGLPRKMPPTFVAHAIDDPVVRPDNSLAMFASLTANRTPAELHMFERGGHNLPLRTDDGRDHPWPGLFLAFAGRHGFMA